MEKTEKKDIKLGSIGEFNEPRKTSPGMVVIWIVLIILMVGSITLRLFI